MSDNRNIDIKDIIDHIENTIRTYMSNNDIDSLNNITSNQFNSLLMFIHKNVFNNGILKSNDITYNYDYILLDYIADYYIYLCNTYNKHITLYSFSLMTGIDDNTVYASSDKEARHKNTDIRQKILKASENALENGLNDGKGNPVGKIAILNHRFNWQTAAAAHGTEKRAKSASELPDFRQNAQRGIERKEDEKG